jgi:hypothetical protein
MKKKKFFILAAVIFTALVFFSASASVDAEKMQEINALDLSVKQQDINPRGTLKPDLNFGKFPLYFIFNKGQVNEKAKFYAKASRYTLWLTKEGLVFDSFKKVKVEVEEGRQKTEDRRQTTVTTKRCQAKFFPPTFTNPCNHAVMHPFNIIPTHLTHLTQLTHLKQSVMSQNLFSSMPKRIWRLFPLKKQNSR